MGKPRVAETRQIIIIGYIDQLSNVKKNTSHERTFSYCDLREFTSIKIIIISNRPTIKREKN